MPTRSYSRNTTNHVVSSPRNKHLVIPLFEDDISAYQITICELFKEINNEHAMKNEMKNIIDKLLTKNLQEQLIAIDSPLNSNNI